MTKPIETTPAKTGLSDATFHPLINLREDIDRIFDGFLTGYPRWGHWADFAVPGSVRRSQFALSPEVDISETENGYEITAELPGMSEKDIEVTVTKDILTLKGEKKEEREKKEKDYYLSERRYGLFQRSFALAADVDADKIESRFSNGVLRIAVPKSAEAKTKAHKIEVKAA